MVKIGITSYSLAQAIRAGKMDILQAVDYAADHDAEHLELSPAGYTLTGNPALVEAIRRKAEERGIALSSYTIGANFVIAGTGDDAHEITPEEYRAEIERVKGEVDIAAALGVTRMRHDAASRVPAAATFAQFEKDLPQVVAACREIADYAAQYGITTSVENHGYHFQNSERVRRLVTEVNRPNYRTTVDVGNFICADEDPLCGTMNNIDLASMVHFKDFYIRKQVPDATTWFRSAHGKYLRGAVTGFGDLDLWATARVIKEAGYEGFVSVEYEGHEECTTAVAQAIKNVRALFEQA